jgi:hypothetical protein
LPGLDQEDALNGTECVTGHVNNVMYNRYAESARVNWTLNFALSDPKHKTQWMELVSPKSVGLIVRSIKTDFKFVSQASLPQIGPLVESVITHETPRNGCSGFDSRAKCC